MTVQFNIPGEPQGKGRPRFSCVGGRVRTYTPEKTATYEELVKKEYKRQCNQHFSDRRLIMRVWAFYSIPKNTSKKKRADMLEGKIRPSKKPDLDNVLKVIADSLNKVAYDDDKQIVEAYITKFYDAEPHVCVMIEEVATNNEL